MTPGNNGEGEVEQGKIVGRLLGPADQDRAEAVEPRVGALHNPAPRLAAGVTLGPGFLASAAQMKREAEFLGQEARLLVVKALSEAEVLRLLAGRLWAPDRDGFEGLAHELVVVAVGPVDHRPKGHAAAVGQQRALDPALAAVGRIAAGFFPHPAAPCPSLRPAPAMSTRCLAARHKPAVPRARMLRTRPPRPIPESADAPRRTSRYQSRAGHSNDTRCGARKRSHPLPHAPARAGCDSPTGAAAGVAEAAPSFPTERPAGASRHREPAAGSSSIHSSWSCRKYGHGHPYCLLGYALSQHETTK